MSVRQRQAIEQAGRYVLDFLRGRQRRLRATLTLTPLPLSRARLPLILQSLTILLVLKTLAVLCCVGQSLKLVTGYEWTISTLTPHLMAGWVLSLLLFLLLTLIL